MDHIPLPIIIADKNGSDLIIFLTIEEAELHIEAIDVINDEYIGFDAEGHILVLETSPSPKTSLKNFFRGSRTHVMIKQGGDTSKHIDELRNRLLDYLNHRGIAEEKIENEHLIQLIQRIGFYGET